MRRRIQLGALYTALAIGAIGWAAHTAVQTFNESYLSTRVFDEYVVSRDRQHLADSLIAEQRQREIISLLTRLDTTLRVCVRHRDTCQ